MSYFNTLLQTGGAKEFDKPPKPDDLITKSASVRIPVREQIQGLNAEINQLLYVYRERITAVANYFRSLHDAVSPAQLEEFQNLIFAAGEALLDYNTRRTDLLLFSQTHPGLFFQIVPVIPGIIHQRDLDYFAEQLRRLREAPVRGPAPKRPREGPDDESEQPPRAFRRLNFGAGMYPYIHNAMGPTPKLIF